MSGPHGEAVPRQGTSDDIYRAVLNREYQELRRVAGVDDLYRWRDRLVVQLARPESEYARAMTPSCRAAGHPGDMQYAVFLRRWSKIIGEAIQRLQCQGRVATQQPPASLATAILAAVRGGVLLARVTDDADTLRNALCLAFDQLCPDRESDEPG